MYMCVHSVAVCVCVCDCLEGGLRYGGKGRYMHKGAVSWGIIVLLTSLVAAPLEHR